MPFEIREGLNKLKSAVKKRIRLNHPDAPGTKDEKRDAEYDVFLASRSAHFLSCDEALWSGVSEKTFTTVFEQLQKAASCISVYPECVKNVRRYLREFKKFMLAQGCSKR